MKKLKKQFWGWGIHVGVDGDIHDVFPKSESSPDKSDANTQKKSKWHVKRKNKQKIALARN
ncbi:MAG: hypothetical protein GX096_07890 [Clostridiales bacterium]|nr:hypothetical protein [Clostridiales bacterium]